MEDSIISLFYQAEDYFFRSISRECLDFDGVATAYLTGVKLESDNVVSIRNHISMIDEMLNRCKIFYDLNHVPWTIVVSEKFISNDLVYFLSSMGFDIAEKSVAMYVELNEQRRSDKNSDVLICHVNDRLEQWMKPLTEAFETTLQVTRQYVDVHEMALKNKANFHHFTLFKDEVAVSSLTLSIQKNIARIDDLGTLPAYQNKGYATQLIKQVINEAVNLGASYCILEARETAISVYQKIGFKALFKNNTYSYMRPK